MRNVLVIVSAALVAAIVAYFFMYGLLATLDPLVTA